MFRLFEVLSPQTRRVLGAAALCAGVYFVAGALRGAAPREVEVSLALGGYGRPVRAVDVTFSRGGEALRALHRDYRGDAPGTFRATVALPEGTLRAAVAVTLDGLVVEGSTAVTVAPGEPLALPPPAAP
ncbi:MAG: hypothetical protein U0324_01900 [Polyangiales bacterium]